VHKTTSLVCLALAVFTSCSRHKPISRDELQSKLRSAESIAAEAGMFLDYVRDKRATHQYARGHIEYLLTNLERTDQELHEALPPAGGEQRFIHARQEVDTLLAELRKVRSRIGAGEDLYEDQRRIAAAREALQQAVSSL
jgi:hypothetical protein